MSKYTIAVDFDGVLHSYASPWAGHDVIPDPPVAGAIDWLNGIVEKLDVVIFTTRGASVDGQVAVRHWLVQHGYTGPFLTVTDRKPPALVYLDDRALRFEGSFPSAEDVHRLRPWHKQPKRAEHTRENENSHE